MKRITKILIFVAAGVFAFTSISFASLQEPIKRPRHIIYKIKDGAQQFKKDRVKKIRGTYRTRIKKQLRGNNASLEFIEDLKGRSEEDICKELVASGGVEFAEPDYLVLPEQIPNDPKFVSQWHHTRINSPAAWDITTGNAQVIVAVCDTGVQSNHPDLAANLLLPGFNTVDGSTNTDPVMGHGTSTTGCIAAIGNNAQGVAGMAWGVKILPIRVSNTSDGAAYYSDLAEAITYAADHGAKAINVSYGVGGSSTIDNAAQYARSKGALTFVAAGNSNVQLTYPDYASFILVGASDPNDAKSSFSNYGTAIDLIAPGSSIYTTSTGSGYGSASGTSFSSPIAAGLAALIFSMHPDFTPSEVENFIFSTCVDLGTAGKDIYFGRGRINAAAAVQAALQYRGNTPPVALFNPSAYSGNAPLAITFDASASYDNDGTIVKYSWDFGDGVTASGKTANHTFAAQGNYSVKLTLTDSMGEPGSNVKTITVYPDPTIITAPGNLSVSVSGHAATLQWTDNSNNEEGFYIERALKTRDAPLYARIAQAAKNTTAFTDVLTASGIYDYRVQAFNLTTGKTSGYSNVIETRVR